MASILKINCTKSRYGWKADAQSAGGDTCYVGRVWNGSATRHYDSSLRFIPPNPAPWGDYPVVIKKITLYTSGKSGSPYNSLNVYLSTTEASYPGSFTAIPSGSIATFNSTKVVITGQEALDQINIYLKEKRTFFFHINRNVDGGIFYGGGSSSRPYIEIEWDYAESTGAANKSSYNVKEKITTTINVKGTGYTHDIIWTINGNEVKKITGTALDPGNHIFEYDLNPTLEEIDKWFSLTSAQATGSVKIITKLNGGIIGKENIVSFTVNLTNSYCSEIGYLKISNITFKNNYTTNSNYIANRSYVTATATWTKYSSNLSLNTSLRIQNGLLGTNTTTSTTSNLTTISSSPVVIGSTYLSATLTLKDGRGLTYTYTKNSSSPINYSEINISSINFYRSDGTKAYVLGELIGCDFKVSTNFPGNKINDIYVSYGSIESNHKTSNTDSFSSTNLFGNKATLATSSSHTLNIYVKDDITSDSKLYGYGNYTNGYYKTTIIIPKAEYIIHIPKGGNGIAFGTAYTETGTKAYIDMGWPVKNLKIEENSNLQLFGSNVNTKKSFQESIGGPFIPTGGTNEITGAVTGVIKLSDSSYLQTSNDYLLLGYDSANGSRIGSHGNTTTIRGSGLLKHYNGSSTYNIAAIGENVVYAADDGTGNPSGYSGSEGMIWLKPIT